METFESRAHSTAELIELLKAARDSARLQLHLLSMDARQRWHDLEGELDRLQQKLERGENQSGASVLVRELTKAVYAVLHDVQSTFELATPVSTLMTLAPQTCSESDTLSRAAHIMWEADCGAVPVVDADGRVVGIISDRDICMASYTRGLPPSELSVSSTMSRDVCTASPEDTLGHAAYVMGKKQVHRLPITEGGRLVGIVSLADIARHLKSYSGNSLPGCVALSLTVATISEPRARAGLAAE